MDLVAVDQKKPGNAGKIFQHRKFEDKGDHVLATFVLNDLVSVSLKFDKFKKKHVVNRVVLETISEEKFW